MASALKTVGIVGGTGWLGRNIALRALQAGVVEPGNLMIASRSEPGTLFAAWPQLRWTSDVAHLVEQCDAIVLSVRPRDFQALTVEAPERMVISVMAGVSTRTLEHRCRTARIIRAMPNAAVEIGRSYTPVFAAPQASQADIAFMRSLFECVGTVDALCSEADLDLMTALSGSGPAFPALLADAMIAHAVSQGLDPAMARRAALGVVRDAAALLSDEGEAPAYMVRTFTDYRGTTAAGLEAMAQAGFRDAVAAGLAAATAKARHMSQEAES